MAQANQIEATSKTLVACWTSTDKLLGTFPFCLTAARFGGEFGGGNGNGTAVSDHRSSEHSQIVWSTNMLWPLLCPHQAHSPRCPQIRPACALMQRPDMHRRSYMRIQHSRPAAGDATTAAFGTSRMSEPAAGDATTATAAFCTSRMSEPAAALQ